MRHSQLYKDQSKRNSHYTLDFSHQQKYINYTTSVTTFENWIFPSVNSVSATSVDNFSLVKDFPKNNNRNTSSPERRVFWIPLSPVVGIT